FDIPKIMDFPAIKHFTKSEINHVASVMDKIEIDESKTSDFTDSFDEVEEILKNIKDSFGFCRKQNLDLITFTH
ncbi:MAG: hypothetical protein ABUT20_24915, partial [Bacteroidota bacterium]